jgi:hypothetical protein
MCVVVVGAVALDAASSPPHAAAAAPSVMSDNPKRALRARFTDRHSASPTSWIVHGVEDVRNFGPSLKESLFLAGNSGEERGHDATGRGCRYPDSGAPSSRACNPSSTRSSPYSKSSFDAFSGSLLW